MNESDETPSDSELGKRLKRALRELQDTMDAAIRAGLIVEPTFKKSCKRFSESGGQADAFVCSVKMYRKIV